MATLVLIISALLGLSTAVTAMSHGAGAAEAVMIHCASSWAFAAVLLAAMFLQRGFIDEMIARMRSPES